MCPVFFGLTVYIQYNKERICWLSQRNRISEEACFPSDLIATAVDCRFAGILANVSSLSQRHRSLQISCERLIAAKLK